MKSLTTYFALFVFLLTFTHTFQLKIPTADFNTPSESFHSLMTCPNPCQVNDSLALIAIYNATQGPLWSNSWNTSLPVCTPWVGVELDNEGYVVRLTLNNNNLNGNIPPEVGNFSRLAELQLDNNNLIGNIPAEIGNLSTLELCFLDNNELVGTIPEEFGNLSILNTLFLDNNNLEGQVPESFINLNNLFTFDIFNNNIDSIPNLSSINLQPNKFRVYNNNLTFDDIVLNDLTAFGSNYPPQDSVFQEMTVNLQTGDIYIIDLDFDDAITENVYQWYRNGIPFGAPLNTNRLLFSPVVFGSAGEYRCRVTNPNAPLLTLHTRPVHINVSCGTSTLSITDTLCPGGTIEINSVVYDETNPAADILLPVPDQYGCDSMIHVDLSFRPESRTEIIQTICTNDSIEIEGIVYNEGNPDGEQVLSVPDQYGCDSIVSVDLTFYTAATAGNLNPVICPGDSIELFGVFYSAANPSGTVVLNNATATGCDSTIFIQVNFYTPAIGSFSPTICEGSSVEYQGQTFNELNPDGQINLGQVSQNGCDSVVNVNVSFFGPAEGTFEDNLCFGDSVMINGTVYNEANPSGTELFTDNDGSTCDSLVFVNLTFSSNITSLINPTLCPGDSVMVNGTVYNEANPNGSEMIPQGSINGCDSTAVVALSFYNEIQNNLGPTLCPGDSIIVNNIVYNEDNPNGTEVLQNASSTGCDSTVIVNLSFHSPTITNIDNTICPEDSIVVNGITYNADNPTGTEQLSNGFGCDSLVNVNLSFYPDDPGFLIDTLCSEQGIFIGGIPFNENNPNGTAILENAGINGCDSTVFVELTFIQASEGILNPTLCPGDSVVVNGVTYNETNPSGVQSLENEASSGCDSLVIIDLNYYLDEPGAYTETLCSGDSLIINGVTYNEDNPSGVEVLENASFNGCDSTLNIDLTFFPLTQHIIEDTLCAQDEIFVNNQAYNIFNPSGTEILENADANGCDSLVLVNLFFNDIAQTEIIQSLCPGDSIVVNNAVYDQDNPNGTEILAQAAANGCDSIITIELSFFEEAILNIDDQLCNQDTLIINNVIYDQQHPAGTEILEGMAQNGCDSIIHIDLSFYPIVMSNISPTLCPGDSLEIGGISFDMNTPSGTAVLENASINGCDSTIQVELNFYELAEADLNLMLCDGDTFELNGTIYDENNPAGTETLTGASVNGCDSIVHLQLDFYAPSESNYSATLCSGESIVINGNIYDQNNSSGVEILENAAANGCDSIVQINLSFLDTPAEQLSETICTGEVYEIAGQQFEASGDFQITLKNAAANGCDSIINLALEVLDANTLGVADAGEDVYLCENKIVLDNSPPPGTSGQWRTLTNESIDLNNLPPGVHTFIWTLSSPLCTDYDADTMQVFVQTAPDAINDNYIMPAEYQSLEIDLLENDDLRQNEAWYFEWLGEIPADNLEEQDMGIYIFTRTTPLAETLNLSYQICDEDCPNLCDTASVQIQLIEQNIDNLDIPNAITPNGDGVNETFMFPHLEFKPDDYPDKELIIFNRWGDIIYEAQPYFNDWSGVDNKGKELPQGTYYYVLRLDIANGVILKGDVTIIR